MDRAVVAGAVAKPGTPRVDQSRTPGRPKSHSGRSRRARVTRASCVGHEPSSVSGSFRGLTGFVLGARRPWRCPRRRGHATAARYRRPLVLVVFRRASLGLAGLVAVLAWTPPALACRAGRRFGLRCGALAGKDPAGPPRVTGEVHAGRQHRGRAAGERASFATPRAFAKRPLRQPSTASSS